MTQEEINKFANSLGQKYFKDENNIWARPNFEAQYVSMACVEMANFVKDNMMNEIVKWLETHFLSKGWENSLYFTDGDYSTEGIVKCFKKDFNLNY